MLTVTLVNNRFPVDATTSPREPERDIIGFSCHAQATRHLVAVSSPLAQNGVCFEADPSPFPLTPCPASATLTPKPQGTNCLRKLKRNRVISCTFRAPNQQHDAWSARCSTLHGSCSSRTVQRGISIDPETSQSAWFIPSAGPPTPQNTPHPSPAASLHFLRPSA